MGTECAQNDLWWKGPDWLVLDSSNCPHGELSYDDTELSEECMKEIRVKPPNESKHTAVNLAETDTTPPLSVNLSEIIDCKHYSSYLRLLRVTAWVKKFIRTLKAKTHQVDKD